MRGGTANPITLHRKRISEMYENFYHNSVSMVIAPVGYGKTVSIRHFFELQKNIFFVSFTFREEENDEVLFWKRFNDIIISDNPIAKEKLQAISLPRNNEEIIAYIAVLKTLIYRDSFCLIDNYHESNSQILNQIIQYLTKAHIPMLHLIISSRTYPAIPCEELALNASCLIIDQNDLLFTREELKQLIDLNHITLLPEQFDWCFHYSGGWAAAVSLLLNKFQQTGRMTHSMSVRALVRSCIINQLDPHEKKILEQLSIVKTFVPDQAAFLTDVPDAFQIICDIQQRFGFISMNEYHLSEINAILQETCIASFHNNTKEIQKIYRKNAFWFEQKRDFISAIYNYMLAEDYDSIIRLLDTTQSISYINQSPNLFQHIMQQIPHPYQMHIRMIFLSPEMLNLFHHTPGEFENCLQTLSNYVKNILGYEQDAHAGWAQLLNAEYLYQIGNVEQALNLAQDSYALASIKQENGISLAAAMLISKCYIYFGMNDAFFSFMPKIDNIMKSGNQSPIFKIFELTSSSIFGLLDPTLSSTPQWIADNIMPQISKTFTESGFAQKAFGYHAILTKSFLRLELIAGEMLADTKTGPFIFRKINGHLLMAISLWYRSNTSNVQKAKALEHLNQAIELAAPDNIIMTFAEYSHYLLPLLTLLPKTSYIDTIYKACEQYAAGQNKLSSKTTSYSLTSREKDIMQLVATGKTNEQISNELHLARITIEKNLSSIYRKFGVKNRAAALIKYSSIS